LRRNNYIWSRSARSHLQTKTRTPLIHISVRTSLKTDVPYRLRMPATSRTQTATSFSQPHTPTPKQHPSISIRQYQVTHYNNPSLCWASPDSLQEQYTFRKLPSHRCSKIVS